MDPWTRSHDLTAEGIGLTLFSQNTTNLKQSAMIPMNFATWSPAPKINPKFDRS